MNKFILTQEVLKSFVDYDKATGVFTWKKRELKYFASKRSCNSWNNKNHGVVAGTQNRRSSNAYINIGILGSIYRAHRLAFFWVNGFWPENEIDHIDGDGSNNSWDNLREVSRSENAKNLCIRRSNKSGQIGVYYDKNQSKWVCQIGTGGTNIIVGRFESVELAVLARKDAETKYGYHDNHGKNRSVSKFNGRYSLKDVK